MIVRIRSNSRFLKCITCGSPMGLVCSLLGMRAGSPRRERELIAEIHTSAMSRLRTAEQQTRPEDRSAR